MIPISDVIRRFQGDLLEHYAKRLLPSHHAALAAMATCRNRFSPRLRAECDTCEAQLTVPHSCGHRACPHCQAHEGELWLERQRQRLVPADYYLITFTLPEPLRELTWNHQRKLYDHLIKASWQTLRTFTRNDKTLHGEAGAIAVLHTHSRRLDYHPHVHLILPAGALDTGARQWRTKRARKGRKPYLFANRALAEVFRAKFIDAVRGEGLALPASPKRWIADCRAVGKGESALIYLSRYLYRGVIAERDIIAIDGNQVTFQYRNAKTKSIKTRTVSGAEFLWMLMRHVLPRRFRRVRNFGYLHPNAKRLIALLQLIHQMTIGPPKKRERPALRCPCCGKPMRIVATRMEPLWTYPTHAPPTPATVAMVM